MAEIIKSSAMEALDTVDIDPSEKCDLLAEKQRWLVLDIISGITSPIELEELSVRVASFESGTLTKDDAVERVAISLHHIHLPRLADVGVLDYDQESNVIEPTEPLSIRN